VKTTRDRSSVDLSAFLLSSKSKEAWDRASSSFFLALLLSSGLNNSGIGFVDLSRTIVGEEHYIYYFDHES
jgi:hypothetical protein